MASCSSMPPPSSPVIRRTRRNGGQQPLSPPATPEHSPCAHRKMSLSKAATFHVSSSPPAEDAPTLSIALLPRRSPTSSRSSLLDLLSEKQQDAARSILDFEQSFSGARGKQRAYCRGTHTSPSHWRRSSAASLSSDEGVGSSISSPTEKDLTGSFQRALDLDSALGSSIKSESAKGDRVVEGDASEDDGPDATDLIQGALGQAFRQPKSALVRSIAPMVHSVSHQPPLSRRARQKIVDLVLKPILQEQRFKQFHPVVSTINHNTNKTIRCLRDLEQSVIFEGLKSASSPSHYRTFGEFTVQLILDSYPHLSEVEQRRPADRPYDNGYFLDLVQQIGRLAARVGASRMSKIEAADAAADEMDYSADDEVTLEGGLAETGHPAELVRWKDGKGTSLRTNEPYEAQPAIKRQHSSESLDGDAERSMARRKKNAEPKITEMRCSDPACDKIFNRKCDLAKHEKTHSRPFKCSVKACKYHDQGLPTEKELERHFNDKHASNPTYFRCLYCPFKTKRDSNCKQHMEKKHDWVYERTKTSKTTRTPLQTPQTPNISTPAASDWSAVSAWESESGGNFTPHSASVEDFSDSGHVAHNPYMSLFPRNTPNNGYAYGSPDMGVGQSSPYEGNMGFSRNPLMNSPYVMNSTFYNPPLTPAASHGQPVTPHNPAYMDFNEPVFADTEQTSENHWLRPHSRNPSISEVSPMITDDEFLRSGDPSHAADVSMGQFTGMGIPNDDFDLFGSSGFPAAMDSMADMTHGHDMPDALNSQDDNKFQKFVNL